jgi:hypothetical protein
MYRIKLAVGVLTSVFSLVYLGFGTSLLFQPKPETSYVVLCLVLGSIHVAAGAGLLFACVKEYSREKKRIEAVIRHLLRAHDGRVVLSDLARYAELSETDARYYLDKRSKYESVFVAQGVNGSDIYFFGQQFWNN